MRFPRIRPEHSPHRYDDGTIRIGAGIYPIAAEIKDASGRVWAALGLMDGRHTPEQIALALRERDASLSEDTAANLVDQLMSSGYIEEAETPAPAGLSCREMVRYERNHAFFRRVDLRPGADAWDAQTRLKQSRVVVLGMGGTGSHTAWALTAAGVGRLHCVDPDIVEVSNLTRQALYTESDIGRPKVEAAAEALEALNSETAVTCEQRMVDSEEALFDLVSGFDVLALCADEPRDEDIDRTTSRACAAAGLPWVSAGYNGPLITVGVYAPQGPCCECVAAGEEARLRPGPVPHLGGPGVIAPSAGISGHLLAYEIISLLTGVAPQPPGYVRGINLLAPDQLIYVRHPARADCTTCHA
ncbi:HesA/MoeB/ThiF family protein [Streptomyces sp. NPDC051569]|uniref:HesA/MoeB/ThiF family protein n=1 Tax=Streptomyces sp. NPDC051569 TaxID=3365661 RepID=UPI0037B832B5